MFAHACGLGLEGVDAYHDGQYDMNNKGDIDRVWDIVEKVGVCMLTTQFAGGLRARPLKQGRIARSA